MLIYEREGVPTRMQALAPDVDENAMRAMGQKLSTAHLTAYWLFLSLSMAITVVLTSSSKDDDVRERSAMIACMQDERKIDRAGDA